MILEEFLFFPVFYFLHGFLPLNSSSSHSWIIRNVPLPNICTPGPPLNASHSALSWLPALPQIGTPLGSCTNSSLCLLSWAGMPSATPCKVVIPLSPTPFFSPRLCPILQSISGHWPWPFPSLTYSTVVKGLELLLELELLSTEPSIIKIAYKLVKDINFDIKSEWFRTLAGKRWHIQMSSWAINKWTIYKCVSSVWVKQQSTMQSCQAYPSKEKKWLLEPREK